MTGDLSAIPPMESISYFTTTLAEALHFNTTRKHVKTHPTPHGVVQIHEQFTTVSQFLDFLALKYPERLAIGSKSSHDKGIEYLSFEDIRRVSSKTATWLKQRFPLDHCGDETVALLVSSTIGFAVVWLALLRLGHKVLLIAPQNPPDTIQHLLKLSKSSYVCCDDAKQKLAIAAVEGTAAQCLELPWANLSELKQDVSTLDEFTLHKASDEDQALTTAYIFHSTGTTGLPKLIPQTHHGAVSVLPRFQDMCLLGDLVPSTFTTTPLYHGGIADLFRCWSAAAPLWIYSEPDGALTGEVIMRCINAIDCLPQHHGSYLAYLSCVPVVLEMILQDRSALKRLRRMERVGVGGAATPKALGDRLIDEGVRLVSRFGSSECGFMLSSERNHASDKDWSLLRTTVGPDLFEAHRGEMFEIVVDLDWPAVSTATHAKRPFHTKDLFKSSEGAQRWQYTSRVDAQLTLSTGKKFDPLIIEEALRQADCVDEALIIGDGRVQPCLLAFASRVSDDMDSKAQRKAIEKVVQANNRNCPPHARVKRRMIKVYPSSACSRLQKNTKGAIIRPAALREFEDAIENLYAPSVTKLNHDSDTYTVQKGVTDIVSQQLYVFDDEISKEKSFFEYGLDSAGCMQIRESLKLLLPASEAASKITLGKIYELDTIQKLSEYIENILRRKDAKNGELKEYTNERRRTEINDLIGKYVSYRPIVQSRDSGGSVRGVSTSIHRTVLLTGATGLLGSHILAQLLLDHSIRHIYVLIRKRDNLMTPEEQHEAALTRVTETLRERRLTTIPYDNRTTVYAADFTLSSLGLADTEYAELRAHTTDLIHAAWEVNFNLPLRSFESQLLGLVHLSALLEDEASGRLSGNKAVSDGTAEDVDDSHIQYPRKRLFFCSSTAVTPELTSALTPGSNLPLPSIGYSQSKLAAEQILQRRESPFDTTILRVGQLCGDTNHGIWNEREAWPLLIHAGFTTVVPIYTGCGSGSASANAVADGHDLGDRADVGPTADSAADVDIVAVLPDLAAARLPGICWLPVDTAARGVLGHVFAEQSLQVATARVENETDTLSWSQFQAMLERNIPMEFNGKNVKFVEATAWLDMLDKAGQHQAQSLISLWRRNWSGQDKMKVQGGKQEKSRANLLSEQDVWRMVLWILGRG